MLHEFGNFALDTDKRQLSRGGELVPLAPKTYELLLLLVESGGRSISKAELMQSLWSDAFVEEANLSFQVSTLRKALGEDGAKWIETVPKHGYRFVGEVVRPKEEAREPRTRRIHWAIPVLVALVVGAGYVFVSFRDSESGSKPSAPVPLTALPGIQNHPSLSPDGSQVAFTWNGPNEDNFDIYVKLVGPGEPMRLTADPGTDSRPVWSPDGRQIAFLRTDKRGQSMLFVIPALGGGLERKIADVKLPSIYQDSLLSWAADSRHIAIATRFSDAEAWGLWLVPIEEGPPKRLTTASSYLPFDSGPAFSPDGKRMSFIRIHSMNTSELWVRSANGELNLVTTERAMIHSATWADNRRIVYSVGNGAGQRLTGIRFVEPGSGKPPTSTGFGESAISVSVSQTGTLVYARRQLDVNLWRVDLMDPSAALQRIAPSSYQNWTPAYSPDGRRIAFASTRGGLEEIWVADANGGHPVQVTRMNAKSANPRWSPDGQSLVFNSWNPRSRLYRVNLSDGSVRPLTDEVADAVEPSWSRDGKWIYFGSTRSGRFEINRVPAGGGPAVQITQNGGLHAEESFDGKWIYYSKDSNLRTSIWKVSRDGGQESLLMEGLSYSLNFAVVEKGIYFIPGEYYLSGRTEMQFLEFSTGKRKNLASVNKSHLFGITLSPDGRSLVYPLVDHALSNLMLVENFR